MRGELKGRVVSVQTLPKKENAEAVVAVALSTRQADMALPVVGERGECDQ